MNIGSPLFKADRQWRYVKYVQLIMVAFLFCDKIMDKTGAWFVIALPFLLIVGVVGLIKWIKFDYDKILREEQQASFDRHPMKKEIKELKKLCYSMKQK